MKGLIIKDILNLRKQIKIVLFIIFFYVVFFSIGFNSEDSNTQPSIISGLIIFLNVTTFIASFSYDEYSKWDKYAASLPITRKSIVLSKYILSLLFVVLGVIISTIYACILIITKNNINMLEFALSTGMIVMVALLIIGFLIPALYKFGAERARLVLVAIAFVPTAIIMLLTHFNVPAPSENTVGLFFKLLPVISILFFVLSFFVSCKIYESKEL